MRADEKVEVSVCSWRLIIVRWGKECVNVERKWTQEQLAEKTGVSTSFVGHIERGEKQASVDTVVTLSKCLGNR